MTTKTFRAVQQGFHGTRLINEGATFTVDLEAYEDDTGDKFEPNWAVEVDDDHEETPGNVGDQEQLNVTPTAALPTITREDQPLAQFHPTVAQSMAVEQANAENSDPATPVKTTAEILAEQAADKPKKSRRKPNSNSIDTGTDASDAEKDEAKEASEAEVEAGENAEHNEDDGNDFV